MHLQTDKIKLRPLEPEDLDLLYVWENDTTLWEVGNALVPFSRYILKQYLADSHRDIFETKQLRLIIENNALEPVGAIDLFDFDPNHRRAGMGILIHSDAHRRKGYATDAIMLMCHYAKDILNLHQIYVGIGANNASSIALFERAHFVLSGVKKDWLRRNNHWEDELIYQLMF
ncbi:MAG: GNAT family N-acetyltransferase [Mangrovibacterium sp.]